MTAGSLVCFGLAAAGALWLWLAWGGVTQDWLPDELRAGKLVKVERGLHTDEPYPVVGRPDQVYRLADGLHAPVELKNRNSERVFQTDIAEISLRAWLLRRNGMQTGRYGWVAINNRTTRRRTAVRVELKDDGFCEQLIRRYVDLVEKRAVPVKSRGKKCETCGHAERCNLSTGGRH